MAFNYISISRLPENEISLLIFMLYFPIGIVLFISRLLLLAVIVILGQVLPYSHVSQKLVNRLACFALGISVTVENPKAKESVKVYVSNSRSVVDQLAVSNVTGAVPVSYGICY